MPLIRTTDATCTLSGHALFYMKYMKQPSTLIQNIKGIMLEGVSTQPICMRKVFLNLYCIVFIHLFMVKLTISQNRLLFSESMPIFVYKKENLLNTITLKKQI